MSAQISLAVGAMLLAAFASPDPVKAATPAVRLVHPQELALSKSFELGQLVLMLMPVAGSSEVGWDHAADSGISWKTVGYEERKAPAGGTRFERDGIVRVSVGGEVSTVLLKRKAELGWTVTLSTSAPPKFGPESIEVRPGLPGEECFGPRYSGCWFAEPLKSLAGAGVAVTRLCKAAVGAETTVAYRLNAPGRKSTALVWGESGGSGGSSAWLTMRFDVKPSAGLCAGTEDTDNKTKKISSEGSTPSASPTRQLEYDPVAAQQTATYNELAYQTRTCLRGAILAGLRYGSRDPDSLTKFAIDACGRPLVNYMTTTMGRPLENAVKLMLMMADEELARTPGVSK